jgi:hypothetical protein
MAATSSLTYLAGDPGGGGSSTTTTTTTSTTTKGNTFTSTPVLSTTTLSSSPTTTKTISYYTGDDSSTYTPKRQFCDLDCSDVYLKSIRVNAIQHNFNKEYYCVRDKVSLDNFDVTSSAVDYKNYQNAGYWWQCYLDTGTLGFIRNGVAPGIALKSYNFGYQYTSKEIAYVINESTNKISAASSAPTIAYTPIITYSLWHSDTEAASKAAALQALNNVINSSNKVTYYSTVTLDGLGDILNINSDSGNTCYPTGLFDNQVIKAYVHTQLEDNICIYNGITKTMYHWLSYGGDYSTSSSSAYTSVNLVNYNPNVLSGCYFWYKDSGGEWQTTNTTLDASYTGGTLVLYVANIKGIALVAKAGTGSTHVQCIKVGSDSWKYY